jgi:hypothetical protein
VAPLQGGEVLPVVSRKQRPLRIFSPPDASKPVRLFMMRARPIHVPAVTRSELHAREAAHPTRRVIPFQVVIAPAEETLATLTLTGRPLRTCLLV